MTKKLVMVLVLAALGWGMVFAGGQGETFLKYKVQSTYEAGTQNIQISLPDGNPVLAVANIDGEYINLFNGENAIPADVGTQIATAFSSLSLNEYDAITGFPVSHVTYGNGDVSISEGVLNQYSSESKTPVLPLSHYDQVQPVEIYFYTSNGQGEKLTMDLRLEFWSGESDLFLHQSITGIRDLNYNEKAIALMIHVLGSDFESEIIKEPFASFLKDRGVRFPINRIFDSGEMATVVALSESSFDYKFPRAIARHLDFIQEQHLVNDDTTLDFPYVEFYESTFDKIYGSDRNIYIAAYLYYIQQKQKPLLSYLIQEEAVGHYLYDYSQYEPLSVDEGKEFAQDALKYLTWGVEYTPFDTKSTYDTRYPGRRVYHTMFNEDGELKSDYEQWLIGTTPDGSNENNYAPFSAALESRPYELDQFTGEVLDNSVVIMGKGTESFEISRAAVYTARNFNHDPDVALMAWNIPNDGSDPEPAVNPSDSYLNVLKNGIIRHDPYDADNPSYRIADPETVVFDRNGDMGLGLGAFFWENKTVGAIYFAKVNSSEVLSDARTQKSGQLMVLNDGKWSEVECQFEIVTDPNAQAITAYNRLAENQTSPIGYSLRSYSSKLEGDYFSNDNSHVVHSYFVLSAPIECEAFMFVDRSDLSRFDIGEMMVFDENPFTYLTDKLAAGKNYDDIKPTVTSFENTEIDWQSGDTEPGNGSYLVTNGNNQHFIQASTINDEPAALKITLNNTSIYDETEYPIRNVYLWDRNGVLISSDTVLTVFGNKNLDDRYFESVTLTEFYRADSSLYSELMTTPFYSMSKGIPGNPIPYAPGGIDSPRTFNYKMHMQNQAQQSFIESAPTGSVKDMLKMQFGLDTDLPSTYGEDSRYIQGFLTSYISEMDLWNRVLAANSKVQPKNGEFWIYNKTETVYNDSVQNFSSDYSIKPFLPGVYLDNRRGVPDSLGENSLYKQDKTAGVDSSGLLMGALSMTSFGANVLSIANESLTDNIDQYFRMQPTNNPDVTGLDSSGKPAYYTANGNAESIADGHYRFTRSDIERSTILIPDISMIQIGDLLVRTDLDEGIHFGIVVGFTNESRRPDYGQNPDEFMKEVIVLSSRKGFRMVNLGLWGNDTAIFNGFTNEPESYQIRRLVKATVPVGELTQRTEEDNFEMIKEYPHQVYTHYASNLDNIAYHFYAYRDVDENTEWAPSRISELKQHPFFMYHPPTSYPDNSIEHSMVQGYSLSNPMVVTNYSGWRNYLSGGFWKTGYHLGADIRAYLNTPYLAPENGEFWYQVYEADDWIELPNGDKIEVKKYDEFTFGAVTVFVSNPENVREGRVYVLAHQSLEDLDLQFADYDPVPNNLGNRYIIDSDSENRQIGIANDIGFGGNNGNNSHLHLEVYEYFPDFDSITFKNNLNHFLNDEDLVSEGYSLSNLKWQRIDPLSLFNAKLLVDKATDDPDWPQRIATYILDHQDEFTDDNSFPVNQVKSSFQVREGLYPWLEE